MSSDISFVKISALCAKLPKIDSPSVVLSASDAIACGECSVRYLKISS